MKVLESLRKLLSQPSSAPTGAESTNPAMKSPSGVDAKYSFGSCSAAAMIPPRMAAEMVPIRTIACGTFCFDQPDACRVNELFPAEQQGGVGEGSDLSVGELFTLQVVYPDKASAVQGSLLGKNSDAGYQCHGKE